MFALPPNDRLTKNCSMTSVFLSSWIGMDTLVWVVVELKLSSWVTGVKSPLAGRERDGDNR